VLARADPDSDRIFIVHGDAVSAQIDVTGFRIAHDDHVVSANIAIAVKLMHLGHRKLEQIDRVALNHIFKDRAGLDLDRRNELEVGVQAVAIGEDQIGLVIGHGQAKYGSETTERIGCARKDPKSLGVAFDVVKQYGR
jgi:hypothetical protein